VQEPSVHYHKLQVAAQLLAASREPASQPDPHQEAKKRRKKISGQRYIMAMAKAAILAVAAVAALAVQLAAAADHPVGGDGSWDASGNGYDAWSAKQTFKQGDTLCKNTKHTIYAAFFNCHCQAILQ